MAAQQKTLGAYVEGEICLANGQVVKCVMVSACGMGIVILLACRMGIDWMEQTDNIQQLSVNSRLETEKDLTDCVATAIAGPTLTTVGLCCGQISAGLLVSEITYVQRQKHHVVETPMFRSQKG